MKDQRTEADLELINAVVNADFDRVKYLVENKGATSNVYDDFGYPLLAIAEVNFDQAEEKAKIADYLIENGANMDLKLENGLWGGNSTSYTVAMELRGCAPNGQRRLKKLKIHKEIREMGVDVRKEFAPIRKPARYIQKSDNSLKGVKTVSGLAEKKRLFYDGMDAMIDSSRNVNCLIENTDLKKTPSMIKLKLKSGIHLN